MNSPLETYLVILVMVLTLTAAGFLLWVVALKQQTDQLRRLNGELYDLIEYYRKGR